MKQLSKSKLKPHLLAFLREVEETGEPIIVTDFNKPVLKIVPYEEKGTVRDVFSGLEGFYKEAEDAWKPDPREWGSLWF